MKPSVWTDYPYRIPIADSYELENYLQKRVKEEALNKNVAIALSGGIDSAILAKFMPKGSTAYTFRCIVPGIQVVDETPVAAKYAQECGLKHKIVEIFWEDFEWFSSLLMKRKGAPIHSIEVLIYKAALQAKEEGIDALIFGENADVIYGGMDGLLSKDWLLGDFIERYSYVLPYKVLRNPVMVLEPFYEFEKDGHIDPHSFVSEVFRKEAMGSYTNATALADVVAVCPFSETYMSVPIDYKKIRSGENKYLVREVFKRLYPNYEIPKKIPMPRPMNEWLINWNGPTRDEFLPHCTDTMTGDQKWLVWALEKFLNLYND